MLVIAAIGKMRPGPELDLVTRYQQRIRPKLTLLSLPDARGSVQEVRRKDGASLLEATRNCGHRVALDEGGAHLNSVAFAEMLEHALMQGNGTAFMIGGAEGLDKTVLTASQQVISFGRMTWPHMMVRAMLTEQIYRARSIAAGHPYHRDTRP